MKKLKEIFTKILFRLLNKKIKIGKYKFKRLNMLPNLMARNIEHDKYLIEIFAYIFSVKSGDIIDVGANIGQTMLKFLMLDKERSYYGFEPQSLACACIESFLEQNKLFNYHILPIALSDENKIMELRVRGSGYYSLTSTVSSLIVNFRPESFYHQKRYIYASLGDKIVEELSIEDISLIKIDVEGGELEVINGLKNTLGRYRPYVIFEVLHNYLAATHNKLDEETKKFRQERISKMEEIFYTNNYLIYRINSNNKKLKIIKKITPKEINDLASTDYLALPKEEVYKFKEKIEY